MIDKLKEDFDKKYPEINLQIRMENTKFGEKYRFYSGDTLLLQLSSKFLIENYREDILLTLYYEVKRFLNPRLTNYNFTGPLHRRPHHLDR